MSEHPEDALPDDFVDELLDRRQASTYLATIGVRRKPDTLAKIFSTGANGPPCRHDGRRPLYPKMLLHEWGVRQLTQLRKSSREAICEHADTRDAAVLGEEEPDLRSTQDV